MPIFKKNVSAICFIICLSVITLFIPGVSAKAQDVYRTDTLVSVKAEEGDRQEQNRILAQMTAESIGGTSRPADKKASSEEDKAEVEDEQDLMEKALELLEIADKYWKNGDIENTVNTLDKAYALVLDTNGDVEIARQKDDLRILIYRRILALYS